MRLAIFDLDGVIVSTDHYHFEAWKMIADHHTLRFDEEINHKLRGVSRRESLQIVLDVNNRTVTKEQFDQMMTDKNEFYKKALAKLTSDDILPGVLDLIHSLKASDIKVAIGSSSKNTPLILRQIGLSQSFDVIVDGNSITRSKPDPEVFTKCAELLEIESEQCVVIEDADAGVIAAKAAGMKVLGVSRHMLIGADKYLETLEGITVDMLRTI